VSSTGQGLTALVFVLWLNKGERTSILNDVFDVSAENCVPLGIMGDVEQLLLSHAVGICIYFFLKYYGILSYPG